MPLTPDPELGSRNDWRWCADCAALKEPWHIHGDPLEAMSRGELLELARRQSRPIRRGPTKEQLEQMHADEMNRGADERDDEELIDAEDDDL